MGEMTAPVYPDAATAEAAAQEEWAEGQDTPIIPMTFTPVDPPRESPDGRVVAEHVSHFLGPNTPAVLCEIVHRDGGFRVVWFG